MKRLWVSLVWLSGCAGPQTPEFRPSSDVEILTSPDAVVAFRLSDGPISPGGRKRVEWHQWPVESSVAVEPALARELSSILSDPNRFALEPLRGSIPRPGVKFVFRRGNATLTAMLCFQSRMITFYGGGEQANFDPSAAALTRIVKKLFPNDPVIQDLK